jgi:hypothetical protein
MCDGVWLKKRGGVVCAVVSKAVVGEALCAEEEDREEETSIWKSEKGTRVHTLIHGRLTRHVRGEEAGEEGTEGCQPV